MQVLRESNSIEASYISAAGHYLCLSPIVLHHQVSEQDQQVSVSLAGSSAPRIPQTRRLVPQLSAGAWENGTREAGVACVGLIHGVCHLHLAPERVLLVGGVLEAAWEVQNDHRLLGRGPVLLVAGALVVAWVGASDLLHQALALDLLVGAELEVA